MNVVPVGAVVGRNKNMIHFDCKIISFVFSYFHLLKIVQLQLLIYLDSSIPIIKLLR